MPELSASDLVVDYPGLGRPALAVPALTFAPGEKVAVTGPSGSGKTTLINLLAGLERVRRGAVRWGGQDLAALSEGGRDRWRGSHVGLVMQDFHLFPGLSALENVLLPQRLMNFRLPAGRREAAMGLLARVGIAQVGQSIETMSRGQMQRVAVARALIARPGILVADEPTASLDAVSGQAVADLLWELAGETGANLIVASHDPLVLAKADRVLRLDAGLLSEG